MLYNLEKADQKAFSQKLLELDQSSKFKQEYHKTGPEQEAGPDIKGDFDLGLENKALKLQEIVKSAAECDDLVTSQYYRSFVFVFAISSRSHVAAPRDLTSAPPYFPPS